MESSVLWSVVECACRIIGISTAAVSCAVGVETLHQTDFHSLAVYLLVCSVGMTFFEVAYFLDVLLATCLPSPPACNVFVMWKKMANVGGFQKFLYYTMMSVVCFLHPVLVWHAVIPGTMLLLTGLFNFILSKRKMATSPKRSSHSCMDTSLSAVCFTESTDTEQTISFLHMISGKRISFQYNNGRLNNSSGCSQTKLGPDHLSKRAHEPDSKADQTNQHFMESFKQFDTEHDMDQGDTTSDKAPMITLNGSK